MELLAARPKPAIGLVIPAIGLVIVDARCLAHYLEVRFIQEARVFIPRETSSTPIQHATGRSDLAAYTPLPPKCKPVGFGPTEHGKIRTPLASRARDWYLPRTATDSAPPNLQPRYESLLASGLLLTEPEVRSHAVVGTPSFA
jgi:hypothetical protein